MVLSRLQTGLARWRSEPPPPARFGPGFGAGFGPGFGPGSGPGNDRRPGPGGSGPVVQGDVVETGELRWLLPIPWIAAGAAGLVATVLPSRRTQQ